MWSGRITRLDPRDHVAAAGILWHGELIGVSFERCVPGAVDRLTGLGGFVRNADLLGLRGRGQQQRNARGCSHREGKGSGVYDSILRGRLIDKPHRRLFLEGHPTLFSLALRSFRSRGRWLKPPRISPRVFGSITPPITP